MPKKLVIVESPAKAKTISRFLGPEYQVEASVGHIRDLPLNKKGLPENLRKKWWADFAVDVDNGFEPFYEVPSDKKRHVDKLKDALKNADELVLATDEDREGESISWHLLQVLKPRKGLPIKRIAFHEITKDAILEAIRNPRMIDEQLVEAQEARRILDRLYGYTLSPVLWSKVSKGLSAGRVQSPAVKLIVERELRRRDFVVSVFWDLKALFGAQGQTFEATLRRVDGQSVASGKDFDELTGKLKSAKALQLEQPAAESLAEAGKAAAPWKVAKLETTPGVERAHPPFRTTTLQQEANRKFGFSADRTMRIAQTLYEGIDLGGESVGLITYMRTDSLELSTEAVRQAREVIRERFGAQHVPDKPNRYSSKVANAQEAHEAIRPTDFRRTPDSVRRHLSEEQRKIYELIYQRTLACQMKPAEVLRTQVEIEAAVSGQNLVFGASGKQITFPGHLLAYVEDVDDAEAALEGKERILPAMQIGDEVRLEDLKAERHETRPPARYTEASLIKALEELGIGRPSTYAQIISVIRDRGYVQTKTRELVPTFVAMIVVALLDEHFAEFSNLDFTAKMDEALDSIANGKMDSRSYLSQFFLGGDGFPGLNPAVKNRKLEIPFSVLQVGKDPQTGKPIVVRIGRSGEPFIQAGEEADKQYGNIPDDLAPADLTESRAAELLSQKKAEPEAVGMHTATGRRLLVRSSRNGRGYYLEVERTPEEVEAKAKPTWVSLPDGADPYSLSQEDLDMLCALPRTIGKNPDTGEEITFQIGKFGPYVRCGKEIRNVEDWRAGLSMSVAQAMELLSVDKIAAARNARASMGPIQDFGQLEGAAGPVVVKPGRFGPYVTDGTTNATIPKSIDPTKLSPEQALELLKAKAAKDAENPGGKKKRGPFRKTRAKK